MTAIDQARIYHYRLPLSRSLPLKGTILHHRQGCILELTSGGRTVYGEAAPLPDFSQESLSDVEQQLDRLCCHLLRSEKISETLYPSVEFALSSALWMLDQYNWKPVNNSVPLLYGDTADILLRLQQWRSDWPAEFKLKIGNASEEADIARINEVLTCLPESVKLRLDANQRWNLQQALNVCSQINPQRIAYIEEPTANPDDFTVIHNTTGVFFALDETLQHPEYVYNSMDGLAALVIKPSLVGGVKRCESLIQAAKFNQVRAVFSSTFESQLGILMLQQLSAHWVPDELPGLDTLSVMSGSLVDMIPQPGQPWSFKPEYLVSVKSFYL